jgi:hypothetical protein
MGRAGSTSWESLRTRFASSGLGPAVRPRLPDHRPRTGTRGRGSKIGALFNPGEAVNPCVQAIAPGARISLFGLQDSCSSRASPPLQPKGGLVGPGSHRRPAFSGGQNGPVLAARSRLTSVSSVGVRRGREDSIPFEPEGGSGLYLSHSSPLEDALFWARRWRVVQGPQSHARSPRGPEGVDSSARGGVDERKPPRSPWKSNLCIRAPPGRRGPPCDPWGALPERWILC